MISEGMKFKAPSFEFDFRHDDVDDIVELTGELKSSDVYGNTYFFQYEFGKNVHSSVRSSFIHALKFEQSLLGTANVNRFIEVALANLNKAVNLANVDVVIYPQSSSSLTRDIVDKIDNFTDSDKYMKVEVVKKSIAEINFNWSKFEKHCENHNVPPDTKKSNESKDAQDA